MRRASRGRSLQGQAWARRSVGLLLSLGACSMERGGLTILSQPSYQTDAATAAVARDPVGRGEAGLPSDADPARPEPWLDAGAPYPLLEAGAQADGWPTTIDLCPTDADKIEPGLCGCGVDERDEDGDGVPDCVDACSEDGSKVEAGACGCGTPDADEDGNGKQDCFDRPRPDKPKRRR